MAAEPPTRAVGHVVGLPRLDRCLVMGVVNVMGSVGQPPAVLGKMIGGALVGTFLGILLSYGFVSPNHELKLGLRDFGTLDGLGKSQQWQEKRADG